VNLIEVIKGFDLPLTIMGLNPARDLGFSCKEAIQLSNRASVVLLRCPFMPEVMQRGAPEIFLHQ
jgi:hypothetical protein